MKLNIGCGYDKLPGFINADISDKVQPDIIFDINKRFPFDDNSCEYCVCHHILEHADDLLFTMSEIHRILTEGGELDIRVPEFGCRASVIDPTHKKFFLCESFMMFCSPKWFAESNFPMNGLFDVVSLKRIRWKNENEDNRTAGIHFTEIVCRLKKVTPDYWDTKEKQENIEIIEEVKCR